jgi:hypothetical protein
VGALDAQIEEEVRRVPCSYGEDEERRHARNVVSRALSLHNQPSIPKTSRVVLLLLRCCWPSLLTAKRVDDATIVASTSRPSVHANCTRAPVVERIADEAPIAVRAAHESPIAIVGEDTTPVAIADEG